MKESFILAIESEEHGKGVVTFSIEGFLADGAREVIRASHSIELSALVRALIHIPDLETVVCALVRTGNTFRLEIDLSRAEAQAIADGLKLFASGRVQ